MKNNKRIFLLLWLVQCLLGFLISLSFVVVAVGGYDVSQYIPAFVIGVIFLIIGIINIVKWHKNK